jgi:hypothetical protein
MGARANSAPKQRAPTAVITLAKCSFQICICVNFPFVFLILEISGFYV